MSEPRSGRDRPADRATPGIDDPGRDHAHRRAGRRRAVLHGLFGLVGIAAVVLLVRAVGPAQLLAIVRASARWIPLLLVIELARVGTDVLATVMLSPRVRRAIRPAALVRMHLLGYAIATLMPAGRAAAEAVKAAMMSRSIGMPTAAAVGATNQALAMLGGALIAIPCAAAAFLVLGPTPLAAAAAGYAVLTGALFTVLQIAYRRRAIGGLLLRRFARAGQATVAFQEAIRAIPALPSATLPVLVGRALQVLELAILLYAVSGTASLGRALIAQGVNLVGGSVGDFIPGQLGAVDAAFAFSARDLGVTATDAVAISIMLHAVQLVLAAAALLITLVWRVDRAPVGAPPDLSAPV